MERSRSGEWSMPVAAFERAVGAREEIRRLETENRLLQRRLEAAQEEVEKLRKQTKGRFGW